MNFIRPKVLKNVMVTSAAFTLLLGIAGCNSLSKQDYATEALHVGDFTPFKAGHKIERSNPSMEEIVLSMDFLQRGDPFQLMRYWVGEGVDRMWKGESWIDLFEGEGDYPPMAVEKIPRSHPLNVKVIVWMRKTKVGKGSPYSAPFLRHEYMFELESEGWRKKGKLLKLGPSPTDKIYLYDSRAFKPVKTHVENGV